MIAELMAVLGDNMLNICSFAGTEKCIYYCPIKCDYKKISILKDNDFTKEDYRKILKYLIDKNLINN